MFTLIAPYPSLKQTTTLLPNPQLSDQEGLTVTVTRKTAMDGMAIPMSSERANAGS